MSSAGSPRWASSQSITAAKALLADDEVAEPEVAVDEAGRNRIGGVRAQPAQPQLDRRQWLTDLVELALPLIDLAEHRIVRRRRAARPRGPRLERMDPSERLGQLPGQQLAGRLELRLAQDARSDRGSLDETPSASPGEPKRPPSGSKASGSGTGTPASARLAERARIPRAIGTSETEPFGSRRSAQRPRLRPRPARSRARRRPGIGLSASSPGSSPSSPSTARTPAASSASVAVAASIRGPRLPLKPVALPVAVGDVGGVLVPVPDAGITLEVLGRLRGIDRVADPVDRPQLVHERAVGAVEREALRGRRTSRGPRR